MVPLMGHHGRSVPISSLHGDLLDIGMVEEALSSGLLICQAS